MAGFNLFPKSIADISLAYSAKLEKTLRNTHTRAVEEKYKPLPPEFNGFQIQLAHEQADEDIRIILGQLHHATLKLQWERSKRWQNKSK